MAKGKNKLNKTNSSGWLDDYSEELSISEYQDGGKLKQYFKLPTKRVAVDNTYNKNSPIGNSSDDKEMVNRLLREKANESQKAKEKRIADVRRLEELNQKSMLETANAKDLYDIGEGMKSKYRFSNEDNFFDDYINPLNMVGGMAGGLAQTPELINQGEYGNAALNVGLPLTVGALAGIGTQNAGQFVNNLVNPLAGAGDLIPSIDKNINNLGFKNYSNISNKLKNTLNNVDYELSTVLKKLDPFYQKKINQELISANQWQKDWYNNFKTRKRIDNLSEEINNDKIKTFEDVNIYSAAQRNNPEALKDFTQDELNSMFPDIPVPENFSANEWDRILDRINNENYLSEFQTRDSKLQKILKGEERLHEGNDGISGYFLDNTFKGKRQNFVNKYANNVKSTAIHEGNHGLTDGNELIPFKERKNIVKIFGDDAKIPKRNSALEFNSYDEYLQDPTEVYARIMELRKNMGLKPGEILENDKFFNIMKKGRQGKTPVDSRFFELIKNSNEFKNLFNRLPTAALPIGIGAASQFYNGQEEGEINQYEDGGKVKDKKSTLSKLKKALSLRENLGNLDTKEGYFTPLNQLLRTAVGMEGKDYSNESMEPIAREQDALRMYLGLPSKTGAFEQTAPNKYRIRDYNKLYPDTLLSDEAVRNWGVPNEDGVPDPVNPAFDLYPYDDFVMGKHYVTKGKDAKGEYLKYSDRFDFDPTRYANQFIDKNFNPTIGKYLKKATPVLDKLESLMFNPFELEDKIYYDPKTKLRSDIILQQNAPKVYPGQPMAVPPEFADGGKVNDNNGYLISNLDNFTPKKIINSNYITTNNMAFPVAANGVVLYPNTGDYVFPTNKVTEIPIIKNGGKINNDMKKKLKKYPAGGYLDYQEGYKGFGVGPQLYQDNSYFRSIMPSNIENMEEEINKPSVFSGINDILGAVNQGVNQATGLLSQFSQPKMGGNNVMSKLENPEDLFLENYKSDISKKSDLNEELDMTGIEDFDMPNSFSGFFNSSKSSPTKSTMGPSIDSSMWKGVPFMKNGGYLKKYQDGGSMDMLPVGSPEYIHKSNVFHENYNPVPRVHFTDDTTPYDMGVNLNDLVNMNGGRINKYQYGGMMPFYSRQRSPRVFNANTNRASLGALEAANANDFLNTKVRKDRQSFEDDKVDWGFMDWAKEPVGAYLGMMSTVPIVGDITKDIVGDSFLTRTGGYAVGKGVGNVTSGAAKVIGGAALTAAGNPQGIAMIGQGVGDVGEGVGSTIGTFQAKDALSNYDKSGYVSGNRLVRSSQDFGNMMDTASSLYGNVTGGVGMAKNMGGLKGMMGNMKGGAKGMKGFGNVMSNLTGIGGQGGGFDFSQLAGMMENGGYLNNYQEGGMVSMPEDFEIPKFKKGGLTPKKAREILHDKSVHGNPLTDKQRKYFGYISSQKKSSGGWLDEL